MSTLKRTAIDDLALAIAITANALIALGLSVVAMIGLPICATAVTLYVVHSRIARAIAPSSRMRLGS